jgi:hypothetical protein
MKLRIGIPVLVFAVVLSFATRTAFAQLGELKIPRGARFQAGTLTLIRAAATPVGFLPAGTYTVDVEYRYMRRVLVVFLREDRVVAEAFGWVKGFPEVMHHESSPLSASARAVDWRGLGFGKEGSFEIRPSGDRDILTIHPDAPFFDRGSIVVRLEPAPNAERTDTQASN